MRLDSAAEAMPDSGYSSAATPYDLTAVIRRVVREMEHGLDIDDTPAIEALARQLESFLVPRIVPDRRYTIRELTEQFGFTRSALYNNHKHIIRKDRRKSFVLGRELLADLEACPRLAPENQIDGTAPPPTRSRGRPRKYRDDTQT